MDLRKLWNDVQGEYQGFQLWWDANWPGELDWGNVPGWVGSILTSVSVLIAISILRNDRKKSKFEMANNFNTWSELRWEGTLFPHSEPFVTIRAFNSGVGPIPRAVVVYRWDGSGQNRPLVSDTGRGTIGPGLTATADTKIEGWNWRRKQRKGEIFVEFTDSANHVWYRDVISGKYVGRRRVYRTSRRSINEWIPFRIKLAKTRRKARQIKKTLPKKQFH